MILGDLVFDLLAYRVLGLRMGSGALGCTVGGNSEEAGPGMFSSRCKMCRWWAKSKRNMAFFALLLDAAPNP